MTRRRDKRQTEIPLVVPRPCDEDLMLGLNEINFAVGRYHGQNMHTEAEALGRVRGYIHMLLSKKEGVS